MPLNINGRQFNVGEFKRPTGVSTFARLKENELVLLLVWMANIPRTTLAQDWKLNIISLVLAM